MDIQTFLDSHPYAETTKRTYYDVLSQIIGRQAALSVEILIDRVPGFTLNASPRHSAIPLFFSVRSEK